MCVYVCVYVCGYVFVWVYICVCGVCGVWEWPRVCVNSFVTTNCNLVDICGNQHWAWASIFVICKMFNR